jgi:PKD repeat protein
MKNMKKSILAIACMFCTGLLSSQSQRLVFLEEFTQASCGPCAAANPAFNALIAANAGKVVSLKYQTSWPGVDPMNKQTASEVATRVSYYGITFVPDGLQDGKDYANPGSITQSTINTEYAVASPFTIQLTHWFNAANDSIFVDCEITCTQAVTLKTPVVRMAMLEKTITFSSPPGSNGETKFITVMRKMLPDASGTTLATTWTLGQKQSISLKAAIPTYVYDKTQLATVAWIQDDATKAVQQAGYSPSAVPTVPPVAAFTADDTTSCDGIVAFKDLSSMGPSGWLWDFGDGNNSTLQNPVHKYVNSGTYTTKLTAKNGIGSNTATKTSYVKVNLSGPGPMGMNAKRCGPGVVNLSAMPSGSGTLNWYDATGALVNTGTKYSPTLTGASINFYVSETVPAAIIPAGGLDSTIGAGAYFTSAATHGLHFDVLKACTLVSVNTYANSAGNRTIQVLDASGTVVQTTVVNIPSGKSTVALNFPLAAGTGYFIQIPSTSTTGLFRNSAGAVYPYTSGVVSVTGSDVAGAYYYYFYDWKVQQNPCLSQATVVSGVDSCLSTGILEHLADYSLSAFPNPGNGIFTVSCQLPSSGNYLMKVTNVLGQEEYVENLQQVSGMLTKQLDLSGYGKGLHFLIVSDGKTRAVLKLLVE